MTTRNARNPCTFVKMGEDIDKCEGRLVQDVDDDKEIVQGRQSMKSNQLSVQPGQTCECGGELVQGTRKRTVIYRGQTSPEFDTPGLYCTQCGEGIVDLRDMELLQSVQNLLKVNVQAAEGPAA